MESKEALDLIFGSMTDYAKKCGKELTRDELESLETINKDLNELEWIRNEMEQGRVVVMKYGETFSVELPPAELKNFKRIRLDFDNE